MLAIETPVSLFQLMHIPKRLFDNYEATVHIPDSYPEF